MCYKSGHHTQMVHIFKKHFIIIKLHNEVNAIKVEKLNAMKQEEQEFI